MLKRPVVRTGSVVKGLSVHEHRAIHSDTNGKVDAVKKFVESEDKTLVCTHATFRFAMERFGAETFDERLIAVDEFHHISANPHNDGGDGVPSPTRSVVVT